MNYTGYIHSLASALLAIKTPEIEAVRQVLLKGYRDGRKIFVAGNGGSAATASHMACDFQKTTIGKEHEEITNRIRCIALTDSAALMTAWGNDVAYEEIFAQQLRALADKGDIFLVISASGNSPNIVKALETAIEMGLTTIGFLGFEGGKALPMCDHSIVVRSSDYGVIEDGHSVLMHMLTAALRETVLG
jgi:D-sedoheptulose 7-phosphate isomerase